MIEEMRPLMRIVFILAAALPLHAIQYQWESKAGESSFTLDVPETWRVTESVKRNGVIVQFRKAPARIEVRSFSAKDQLTIPQIVNQKAARLASDYSFVRLIEERDSRYRENLHLSIWEIRARGHLYREETAIVVADTGPVVVSCVIPATAYAKYRTACDNAFYSLVLDGARSGGATSTPAKQDNLARLQNFYFLHIPGNLPVLAPEALMKDETPTKPRPSNYDENFILPNEIR